MSEEKSEESRIEEWRSVVIASSLEEGREPGVAGEERESGGEAGCGARGLDCPCVEGVAGVLLDAVVDDPAGGVVDGTAGAVVDGGVDGGD